MHHWTPLTAAVGTLATLPAVAATVALADAGDITFSTASIGIVGGLLGGMALAVTALFKLNNSLNQKSFDAMVTAKDQVIAMQQERISFLVNRLGQADGTVTAVQDKLIEALSNLVTSNETSMLEMTQAVRDNTNAVRESADLAGKQHLVMQAGLEELVRVIHDQRRPVLQRSETGP